MTGTSGQLGWRARQIDEVARELERTLAITLEPRDSLYRGEYYNWRGEGSAHLLLQQNFIEEDDGLRTNSKHPDHLVLMYCHDVPAGWLDRIAALDGADRLEEG
jgi:hypothetical protein